MVIVEEEEQGTLQLRGNINEPDYDEESEYEDVDDEQAVDGGQVTGPSAFLASIYRTISQAFSASSLPRLASRLYTFISSSAWVLTTTLIMVGLPILYAYDREQNLVATEREQQRFDTAK
jgi:hypothetical protein